MKNTYDFITEYLDNHNIVAKSIDPKVIGRIIKLLEKAIAKEK